MGHMEANISMVFLENSKSFFSQKGGGGVGGDFFCSFWWGACYPISEILENVLEILWTNSSDRWWPPRFWGISFSPVFSEQVHDFPVLCGMKNFHYRP